ncbi:FAD/NAD(P)-binding domain-containing protein [Auricularia subglabra TFB-10046 SS5]|nr:FAD/NAD(P)-binding domain-containing protein [Auricularia subglabra TFB-10046 SS5]
MIRAEGSHERLAQASPINIPKRGLGKVSSIHRAQLLDILVKRLPSECVHLGKRCISVKKRTQDSTTYVTTFADGTAHFANVIIGADGMRSIVRNAVLDYYVEPRYQGSQAFRGLFPGEIWEKVVGKELGSSLLVYVGAGKKPKHVVVYPIDGGQANLVAFSSNPRGLRFSADSALPRNEAWVQPASYDHAVSHFTDLGPHVQAALAAVDPERVTVWKIHLLWPPIPTYVRDGVAVLGDAAHGMPPHCGQGAGQSLEDAYILGRLLGHPKTTLATVSRALRVYDEVRRPRGNRVLEFTLESGDVWESWGPSGDSVEGLKADMADRLNWIWDHDLEADWERAKRMLEEPATNGTRGAGA